MSAGIVSYGAYVPPTRLGLSVMAGRAPKEGEPEKAVAWSDEDAVTMGVGAARSCLAGLARDEIDALFFATTSHPFREKQTAALVAKALGLRRDLRTVDLAGSLRAGLSALRSAADAVAAGSARRALVVASDCRMAAPGSPLERNLGDGAAAFLLAGRDAIATLDAAHAVADEIVDVWRGPGDRFVHAWEERFVVQEGYVPRTVEAVRGLLAGAENDADAFARVALYAPDARSHATVAKQLGVARERLQDPLFGRLGNAGCAFAPLLLAAALEEARPGERILVAGYGDGAEALAFTTTDALRKLEARRGVAWHLARRRPVRSYAHYRRARNLEASEWERGADPGLSATIHFRERDEDLGFTGQRCAACGAVQFPRQRVCESCFAKDRFEDHPLAERTGRVVTWTLDHFFPTPEPPTIVTVTEIDGARVHLQLADTSPEDLRPGMPVAFVFRRIHEVGGRPNYYWKAIPLPE